MISLNSKISSKKILREWKDNCLVNRHLFAGQNIGFDSEEDIKSFDVSMFRLQEVNTPLDYLNIISATDS